MIQYYTELELLNTNTGKGPSYLKCQGGTYSQCILLKDDLGPLT